MTVGFNDPSHNISDTTPFGVNVAPGSPGFWITLATGGVIMASAPVAVRAFASTASARLAISYTRKPMLTLAANEAKSGIVRAAARVSLGVSKAYGIGLLSSRILNPFQSIKYAMRGDLKRAALAHYGPLGAVWVYNRNEQRMERSDRQPYRSVGQPTNLPSRTPPSRKGKLVPAPKKKTRISRDQKNRLWRMGLRWCPKHKRYDKCSLRAR
jgi:hypothetical protein